MHSAGTAHGKMAIQTAHYPHELIGRLVTTGEAVRLTFTDERITGIAPLPANLDASLPWLGAGLVDLQVNGYAGWDFNATAPSADIVRGAVQALWREGVTTCLPTIITNTDAAITASLRAIADARRADSRIARTIAGVHLEGPFISPEDGARGAHNRMAVCPPDWARFMHWQEAADGAIRLVTLSPEWPEAVPFIARCVAAHITVAIGHTVATPDQISAAVAAGARLSTHLGNGAPPLLPRHPNILWEQLAHDDLWASVIGDGFHLPDTVLKVIIRVKGDHAFLVSDTVALAGMPTGEYDTPVGGHVAVTPEGRLVLASDARLLAGSICPLRRAVAHLVRSGVTDVPTAWAMASTRPARFLDLPVRAGLAVGAPADIVVWTGTGTQVTITQTYKNGVLVSDHPEAST